MKVIKYKRDNAEMKTVLRLKMYLLNRKVVFYSKIDFNDLEIYF